MVSLPDFIYEELGRLIRMFRDTEALVGDDAWEAWYGSFENMMNVGALMAVCFRC